MKVGARAFEPRSMGYTLPNPMDCSPPGSSVHGFSRQEYWSGVPSPSPTLGTDLGQLSEKLRIGKC